jgi:UDP-glucose 4-epimerase
VFTSTTSLMISQAIRDGQSGGAARAAWLTEDMAPEPRNIYGVTKLSAEHLCRLYHLEFDLPVIVLRTARFFPEADDMAHEIEQSDENTKANEFLFRRLTVEDAAEAHVLALEAAPRIGFDTFIISASTPFAPTDCAGLISAAPDVVARYFPDYRRLYAARGWTMFRSIDRVYDSSKAREKLGFVCRTGFAEVLAGLEREGDPRAAQ